MTDPVVWSAAVSCEQCWHDRLGGSGGGNAEAIDETVAQLRSQGVRCTVSKGCLGLCEHEQGVILRGSHEGTVTTAWVGDIRTGRQMKDLCRWLKRNEAPSTLPVGRLLAESAVDGRPGATFDVVKELELRLRIAEIREETTDVRSILLESADDLTLSTWTPGAHIDVGLPGNLLRQYSLCGDPAAGAPWRIAVLREPESRGGSVAIHEKWTVGDVVHARGPRNNFGLKEADRYIFIAGGIGITPILPMIRAAEADRIPWTLAYGGRSRRSMAFLDELQAFGASVEVIPEDRQGLIPLDRLLDTPDARTFVYCCGPSRLLSATRTAAQEWPDGNVVFESFAGVAGVAGVAVDGSDNQSFEVELAASGRVVAVSTGRTILEALQEEGLHPIAACRNGVCGSCETAVVSGEPDHRDATLSREERESNRSMMICVSRSHTDRLVLDL